MQYKNIIKPIEDKVILLQHAFPIDPSPSILGTSLQRVNDTNNGKRKIDANDHNIVLNTWCCW